jgi:hypothetical protein
MKKNIARSKPYKIFRIIIYATALLMAGVLTANLLIPHSPTISIKGDYSPAIDAATPDFQPDTTPSETPKDTTPKCVRSVDKQRPYLISISAAKVANACIEHTYVGEKAPGQLDDPKNKWNFGWFRASALPGAKGAGVYTCHDGNGNLQNIIPAICNSLNKLKIGDQIIVENSAGQKFTYKVVHAISTPVKQVNMQQFQSVYNNAARGLSIMACDGRYDSNHKRTHRFLVYAHQIN